MDAAPPNNMVPILTTVLAVLGTIAGVVIGNRLTYARSSKEKIWDLRRAAYGEILAELAAVERIYDDADVYISERSFADYFEQKAYTQDNEEIDKHMVRVRDRFAADYLILSDDFIKLYDELVGEMRNDPYSSLSPDEEYEVSSDAIRRQRPLLVTLARNEMAANKI
jgi:hypothetical protein